MLYMKCENILKDRSGNVTAPLQPNGFPSELFNSLKQAYGVYDAITIYEHLQTKSFLETYGDWVSLNKRLITPVIADRSDLFNESIIEYLNENDTDVLNIKVNSDVIDRLQVKRTTHQGVKINFVHKPSTNTKHLDYSLFTLEEILNALVQTDSVQEVKDSIVLVETDKAKELTLNSNGEPNMITIRKLVSSELKDLLSITDDVIEEAITDLPKDMTHRLNALREYTKNNNRKKGSKSIEAADALNKLFGAKMYNSIIGTDVQKGRTSLLRMDYIMRSYFNEYGNTHDKETLDIFFDNGVLRKDIVAVTHTMAVDSIKKAYGINILKMNAVEQTSFEELGLASDDNSESVDSKEVHGDNRELLKEQGFQFIDKSLRAFIDMTTYIDRDSSDNIVREKLISGENVFRLLQVTMSWEYNAKLNVNFDNLFNVLAQDNPQVLALYNKYLAAVEVNPNIREVFIKEVDVTNTNHITLLYDPAIRKSRMFKSNLNGYDRIQVDAWHTTWKGYLAEANAKDTLSDRLTTINKIRNEIKPFYNNKVVNSDMVDEIVNKLINRTSDINLEEATGIKLSKGFVRYSLLKSADEQGIYLDINPSDRRMLNNINLERHFNKPLDSLLLGDEILDHFHRIAKEESNDYNPYSNTYEILDPNSGVKTKVRNTEITGRLKGIALGNSLFDEEVIQNSFKNASGDTLFDLAKPGFLTKHVRTLGDPAYRTSVREGHLDGYVSDSIIGNNTLLNLDEGVQDAVMGDISIMNINNISQAIMGSEDVNGELPSGSDFKGITSKMYTLLSVNYFVDRYKYGTKYSKTELIPRFILNPYILETSNTSHGVFMPVGLPTIENNVLVNEKFVKNSADGAYITDTVLDLFEGKVEAEYRKMHERKVAIRKGVEEYVRIDLEYAEGKGTRKTTAPLYDGYDVEFEDGKFKIAKQKAFKFFITRKFLSETKSTILKDRMSEHESDMKAFEDEINAYYTTLASANSVAEMEALITEDSIVEKPFLNESQKEEFKFRYSEYLKGSYNNWVTNSLIKEGLVTKDANGNIVNKLIGEQVDTHGDTNSDSSIIAQDYDSSIEYMLLDYYVNSTFWSMDFNELVGGDQSFRKDATDLNKRIKGGASAGSPLGTGLIKVAIMPEQSYSHPLLGEFEHADAQSYATINAFREIVRHQGRYTKGVSKILQKVALGLPITNQERKTLEKNKAAANSLKDVYYNTTSFHKDSVAFLLPEETSYIPSTNQKRYEELIEEITELETVEFMAINPKLSDSIAKYNDKIGGYNALSEKVAELYKELNDLWLPRYQFLHDLRLNMERDGISIAVPPSASKLKTSLQKGVVEDTTTSNMSQDFRMNFSSFDMDARFWKEVVEVNSGKTKITYFSQIMRLIESGHTDSDSHVLGQDGEIIKVSEELDLYRNKLGLKRIKSMAAAIDVLKTDGRGNYTNESISNFNKKLESTLKASGGDKFMIDLFGDDTIDNNISITADKFIQLFLSHFDKGVLTQSATGTSSPIQSDAGFLVKVRLDEQGNELGIITSIELEELRVSDPTEYDEIMAARSTVTSTEGETKEEYVNRKLSEVAINNVAEDTSGSIDNIKLNNFFTVNPIQTADKKAITKAKYATKYIGFGEGIAKSSTDLYSKQAGKFANTGRYSSDDVIFVSIGGKRGGVSIRKAQQDKTIKEAIKALEAGSVLITDNKQYTFSYWDKTSKKRISFDENAIVPKEAYNEGEIRLYKNLNAKGYVYQEVVKDGISLGTWVKESKSPLQANINKTTERSLNVAKGVYINQNALTDSEQKELFDILKPTIEEQAFKTNAGKDAPLMIGLGLRWDYKKNNPGVEPVFIKETIVNSNSQRNKYAYYDVTIDGKPLSKIPTRLKELVSKATGIDSGDYDGAIINIYKENSFISAHNDVDESSTAINYPVLVVNIGGEGSLSIEGAESQKNNNSYYKKQYSNEKLSSGSAYVFGKNGNNRKVFHRTLPSNGKGNLPALTVRGKTIPANSYRISITLRRVKDLEGSMPNKPTEVNKTTEPSLSLEELRKKYEDEYTSTNKETVTHGRTSKGTIVKQRRLRWSRPELSRGFSFSVNGQMITYTNEELLDYAENDNEVDVLMQTDQLLRDLNDNVEIEDYGNAFARYVAYRDANKKILDSIINRIKQEFLEENDITDNSLVKTIFNVGAVTRQGFSEVMIARYADYQYSLSSEDMRSEAIREGLKMFGGRIPSQEYHSMMSAIVVDFLPSAKGDSMVIAREVVPLSGADFDIDKVYAIRKAMASVKAINEKGETYNVTFAFGNTTLSDKDIIAIKARELSLEAISEAYSQKANNEDYFDYVDAKSELEEYVLTESAANTPGKEIKAEINVLKANVEYYRQRLLNSDNSYLLLRDRDVKNVKANQELIGKIGNRLVVDLLNNDVLALDAIKRQFYYDTFINSYTKSDPRIKEEIGVKIEDSIELSFLDNEVAIKTEQLVDVQKRIKEIYEIISESIKDKKTSGFIVVMDANDANNLINEKSGLYDTNNRLLSEIYLADSKIKKLKKDIVEQVVVENGIPSMEDYTEDDNPLAIHNRVVDSNMNLYNDPTLVNIAPYIEGDLTSMMDIGITQSPAVMYKIQGTGKNKARNLKGDLIKLTNLGQMFVYMREAASVSNYDTFTPGGKTLAFESNKISSKMIGPAAIAKILKSKLAALGVYTPSFNWDNETFNEGMTAQESYDIEFVEEFDENNERIFVMKKHTRGKNPVVFRIDDELSTMISVMTDASKWNDPYMLQLTFKTLGTYLYLISTGVGINRAMLLSQMSFIQILNRSDTETEHQVLDSDMAFKSKGDKLALGAVKLSKDTKGVKVDKGLLTAAAIITKDTLEHIVNNVAPSTAAHIRDNYIREGDVEIENGIYENLNNANFLPLGDTKWEVKVSEVEEFVEFDIEDNIDVEDGLPNREPLPYFDTHRLSFNIPKGSNVLTSLDSDELFDAVATRDLVKYFTSLDISLPEGASMESGLDLELHAFTPEQLVTFLEKASVDLAKLTKNVGSEHAKHAKWREVFMNYTKLAKLVNTNFKALMFFKASNQISTELLSYVKLLQVDKGINPSFDDIDAINQAADKLGFSVVQISDESLESYKEHAEKQKMTLTKVVYGEFNNEKGDYYIQAENKPMLSVDYSNLLNDPLLQTNLVSIHKITNEISPNLLLRRGENFRVLLDAVKASFIINNPNDAKFIENSLLTYITTNAIKVLYDDDTITIKPELLFELLNTNYEVEEYSDNKLSGVVVVDNYTGSKTLYENYTEIAATNPIIKDLYISKLITSPIYNRDSDSSPVRFGIESFVTKSDAINSILKRDMQTIKEESPSLYEDIVNYLLLKDGLNIGKDSVLSYLGIDVFEKLSQATSALRLASAADFNLLTGGEAVYTEFLHIMSMTAKGQNLLPTVSLKSKTNEPFLPKAGISIINPVLFFDSEDLAKLDTNVTSEIIHINVRTESEIDVLKMLFKDNVMPAYFKSVVYVEEKPVLTLYKLIETNMYGGTYIAMPEHNVVDGINPFAFESAIEISELQESINKARVMKTLSQYPINTASGLDLEKSKLEEGNIPVTIYEENRVFGMDEIYFTEEKNVTDDIKTNILNTLLRISKGIDPVTPPTDDKVKSEIKAATSLKSKEAIRYSNTTSYSIGSGEVADTTAITDNKGKVVKSSLEKLKGAKSSLSDNTIVFVEKSDYSKSKRLIDDVFSSQRIIVQDGDTYTLMDNGQEIDVTDSVNGISLTMATVGANLNVSALVAVSLDPDNIVEITPIIYEKDAVNNFITSTEQVIGINTIIPKAHILNKNLELHTPINRKRIAEANKRHPLKDVRLNTEVIQMIGGNFIVETDVRVNSGIESGTNIYFNNDDTKRIATATNLPFKISNNAPSNKVYNVDSSLPNDLYNDLGLVNVKYGEGTVITDRIPSVSGLKSPAEVTMEINGVDTIISEVYGFNAEAYIRANLPFGKEDNPDIKTTLVKIYTGVLSKAVIDKINKEGGITFLEHLVFNKVQDGSIKKESAFAKYKKEALIEAYINEMIKSKGYIYKSISVKDFADGTLKTMKQSVVLIKNSTATYLDVNYLGSVKGTTLHKIKQLNIEKANDSKDVRDLKAIVKEVQSLLSITESSLLSTRKQAVMLSSISQINALKDKNVRTTANKFRELFTQIRILNYGLKAIGSELSIPFISNIFHKPMNDVFVIEMSKLADDLLYSQSVTDEGMMNKAYSVIFGMSKSKFDEQVVKVFDNTKMITEELAKEVEVLETRIEDIKQKIINSKSDSLLIETLNESMFEILKLRDEINTIQQDFDQRTFNQYKQDFENKVVNGINDITNGLILDLYKQQYSIAMLTNVDKVAATEISSMVLNSTLNSNFTNPIKEKYDKNIEAITTTNVALLPRLKNC